MISDEKKETVFVNKYKYKDVNDLLNEILRRIEMFNKINGYVADKILMSYKQYLDILDHNKSLIKNKDDNNYILCTKIIF